MSDFEVQVLDLLKSCSNSLYVIGGFCVLLAFVGAIAGFLWAFDKDQASAEKKKKELKN